MASQMTFLLRVTCLTSHPLYKATPSLSHIHLFYLHKSDLPSSVNKFVYLFYRILLQFDEVLMKILS